MIKTQELSHFSDKGSNYVSLAPHVIKPYLPLLRPTPITSGTFLRHQVINLFKRHSFGTFFSSCWPDLILLCRLHIDDEEHTAKMSNAKYQPAPQRDSFDEPSYSQAPPSYQEQNSQSPLLGPARTEDDNLPDDFKFGGVVAEATLDIRMAFVRKVYAIL
jgi:hypothetical protein